MEAFEKTVREILDTPGGDPIYKLHCIKTALNEIDAGSQKAAPSSPAVEGADAPEVKPRKRSRKAGSDSA